MVDFETALDKLVLGAARPLVINEKDRRVIAYHEAGHALCLGLRRRPTPCTR